MKIVWKNIQLGDTWATKVGDKYVIIKIDESEKYGMMAIDEKKRITKFTANGSYMEDSYPHPFDLVTKV